MSPATAHRWWHRWLEASEEARADLSCLLDRSSRPYRSPRQLAPELAEAICACRRQTGWGPRLVAGATGFCHSTVWKVLRRAGHLAAAAASAGACQPLRVALPRRPAAHGHQRVRALPAARSPRHRRPLQPGPPAPDGVDCRARDRRRPLPARLRRDPRRRRKRPPSSASSTAPSPSTPSHGITPRRLMTDNAWAYARSRARPPAARPATNPAPDHQALPAPHQRQGRTLPPNDGTRMGLRARLPHHTTTAPPPCHTGSTTTTRARPHSSLGGQTPISRVHNVRRQDI